MDFLGECKAVTAASTLCESDVPGSTRSVSICVLLCLAGAQEIGTCTCRAVAGQQQQVMPVLFVAAAQSAGIKHVLHILEVLSCWTRVTGAALLLALALQHTCIVTALPDTG